MCFAAFSASNIWLRVSERRLLVAQDDLIRKHNPGLEFCSSVVAGLGTVEVLRPDGKQVTDATVSVVLIHGYGTGNANYMEALSLLGGRYCVVPNTTAAVCAPCHFLTRSRPFFAPLYHSPRAIFRHRDRQV